MDEKERGRTLTLTLGQIEKQFGKGSILRLGAKEAIVPVSAISTGSISLDYALASAACPAVAFVKSSARSLREKPPLRSR